MRATTVLKRLLGLGRAAVVRSWELVEPGTDGARPKLVVKVRTKAGRRGRCGRCGRCGEMSPWFDRGDGERSWRHLDVAFATYELVADAPRVTCRTHGPTVAEAPWARPDSAFTRAFEDLVVHDAVVGNKAARKGLGSYSIPEQWPATTVCAGSEPSPPRPW